jgi:lipid II:glycine glycyltransferase (peptidoglycan interpeptide bridge formation enzyme)
LQDEPSAQDLDIIWAGRRAEKAKAEVNRLQAHLNKYGTSQNTEKMLAEAMSTEKIRRMEHEDLVLAATTVALAANAPICPARRM